MTKRVKWKTKMEVEEELDARGRRGGREKKNKRGRKKNREDKKEWMENEGKVLENQE